MAVITYHWKRSQMVELYLTDSLYLFVNQLVIPFNHIHIWQVSPQLSCRIWMWYCGGKKCLMYNKKKPKENWPFVSRGIAKRASNMENVSMSWRHHTRDCLLLTWQPWSDRQWRWETWRIGALKKWNKIRKKPIHPNDHSEYGLSHREEALLCNACSHWLSPISAS